MKLLYIAGQYSFPDKKTWPDSRDRIDLNIAAARHAGAIAAERGWFPVIPHANTAHFERYCPMVSREFWLDGTMVLLSKCDAILMIQGYEDSAGAKKEEQFAKDRGMRIYRTTAELPSIVYRSEDE